MPFGQVVRDERADDADEHHDEPVEPRHVRLRPHLHDEHDREHERQIMFAVVVVSEMRRGSHIDQCASITTISCHTGLA
jgi:hypothetical protein